MNVIMWCFCVIVAPMRGRGFMLRGSASNRGHDPFRNRAPNTSRPPSMHVDDFVKIEQTVGTQASSVQQPPLRVSEVVIASKRNLASYS